MDVLVMLEESPDHSPMLAHVNSSSSPLTNDRQARDIVTLVPNGHYDFASGSSLATAQVTGVVALLLARNQKLGVERMRTLLEQSTVRHDTTRGPFLSVNACAALAQVVPGAVCAQR